PRFLPSSTVNNGVLYKPAVSLKEFKLFTVDNKPFTLAEMRGKWSLIYIGQATCNKACKETLIKARDARWAQGMQAKRINYYYLLAANAFTGDQKALSKEFPGMIRLHGDAAARQALIAQFRVGPRQQPGTDNRLYLVHPCGSLMLQYPYVFRHIGLMDDLKRLLTWSRAG
ncbi:MAG: SCO family protein, partial [Gammaproteobacteria bacterium]